MAGWGQQLDGLQQQIAAHMELTRGLMSEVADLKVRVLAEGKPALVGWGALCTGAIILGAVVAVLAFVMSN